MAGAGAGAPSPPPGVYIQQLSALPVAPEVPPPWPSAGEHAPGDVEAPNAARGVQVTPRRSPRSPRARVVSQAGLYAVRKQKCLDGPAPSEDYDHEVRLPHTAPERGGGASGGDGARAGAAAAACWTATRRGKAVRMHGALSAIRGRQLRGRGC